MTPHKDVIEPKAWDLFARSPARPDVSVVQHLVNSGVDFKIPTKRETPKVQFVYKSIHTLTQALKSKDEAKPLKKFQIAPGNSNGCQNNEFMEKERALPMPPQIKSFDVLKLKKRGRPKALPDAPQPAKKSKEQKPKKPLPLGTLYRQNKSTPELTPPPSSRMTERERSAIQIANEIVDPSLRRSVRKVIRPKHLAPDDENQPPDAHSSDEDTKDYSLCAAVIPDMIPLNEALIGNDRDEPILTPEAVESLDDISLRRYALACEAKIGCDMHTVSIHCFSYVYFIPIFLGNLSSF